MSVISNKETFLSLARDAHQKMKRLLDENRTPKPDGSPGHIVKLDPEQRAFKQALIAITFSGIYFEAFAYFVARLSNRSKAEKVDKARGYHAKLQLLGIEDAVLLEAAESFRKARNDLVHEKASSETEIDFSKAHFAESCADKAMEFIALLHQAIPEALSGTPTQTGNPSGLD